MKQEGRRGETGKSLQMLKSRDVNEGEELEFEDFCPVCRHYLENMNVTGKEVQRHRKCPDV